ncbi:MAG: protein translocase subunit SecD, partial [Fusobacteriaceae bacterium]
INSGFKKGFSSIVDSNVTTIIITTILFIFGTGAVKGFAITLTIGVVASMFTAITLTKVILIAFVESLNLKKPELFGVKRGIKNV